MAKAATIVVELTGQSAELVTELLKAERAVRKTERRMRKSQKAIAQAGIKQAKALKAATASLVAALGVRQIAVYADAWQDVQNKLKIVTTDTENLASVTEELMMIAQRTRSSFEGVSELYARVALATKELGIAQSELLAFTEAVSQAIIVSGASASEAQAGLIQLAQGMASGALRGDELRSVLEQLPRLGQAIATGMGKSFGELRELGKEGALTTQVILDAVEKTAPAIAAEFAQTVPTISQTFQTVRNSILESLGGPLSQALRPAVAELGESFTGLVGDIAAAENMLTVFGVVGANAAFVVLAGINTLRSALLVTELAIRNTAAAWDTLTNQELSIDLNTAQAQNIEDLKRVREQLAAAEAGVKRFQDANAQIKDNRPYQAALKAVELYSAELERLEGTEKKIARARRDGSRVLKTEAGENLDTIIRLEERLRDVDTLTPKQLIEAFRELAETQREGAKQAAILRQDLEGVAEADIEGIESQASALLTKLVRINEAGDDFDFRTASVDELVAKLKELQLTDRVAEVQALEQALLKLGIDPLEVSDLQLGVVIDEATRVLSSGIVVTPTLDKDALKLENLRALYADVPQIDVALNVISEEEVLKEANEQLDELRDKLKPFEDPLNIDVDAASLEEISAALKQNGFDELAADAEALRFVMAQLGIPEDVGIEALNQSFDAAIEKAGELKKAIEKQTIDFGGVALDLSTTDPAELQQRIDFGLQLEAEAQERANALKIERERVLLEGLAAEREAARIAEAQAILSGDDPTAAAEAARVQVRAQTDARLLEMAREFAAAEVQAMNEASNEAKAELGIAIDVGTAAEQKREEAEEILEVVRQTETNRTRIEEREARRRLAADKKVANARKNIQKSMYSTFTTLATAFAGENEKIGKAIFLANQAVAFAGAIIDANKAYTLALSHTPAPAGIPIAEAVRAQGYAAAGLIASQTVAGSMSGGSGGGGGGGFGGGGVTASAPPAQPSFFEAEDDERATSVQFIFEGPVVADDEATKEYFADIIREAVDRDVVVVPSTSRNALEIREG